MVKTKNLKPVIPVQAPRRQLKHKTLMTVKLMLSFAFFLSKLLDTTGPSHYPSAVKPEKLKPVVLPRGRLRYY
ncbi:hypothetical protein L1M68_10220 [Coxiella burnetii]|uniref:Uncharacterized protein n=1 Tax=Coxiella burnetii (strain RSA 493 / Nine Mile phase I) TaxID=227377 RepID=B5QS91_COXBU|nr:hypothetical protein [Coxiella burnetii]YP_002332964.1 hypothetical protein CBU_0434a [Coxiella burnetii RSA 493]ACI15255.1 hypothetical protein CBU_0434a [Coxiella burnetii RSA 493]ARI65314.1 hypothetical protein B7L74_02230 [Coxiella burnetii]ARK26795.1 hypothetical protein BMW92_02175 [Coxiella burnetii]MCF2093256.1 hypothetical protein [Coxiella burnetii]MCF2096614.1 hypothetical protein [Coxiella burnetii]